ncbi:PAS domain S-box protein [Oryzomonas rubra]|uniref:histidine kinase n=2 Tax=Oryzomonas rubra TaxID=2509454 RepID=A0A5A9XLH8_9BACT|nr:PAS domain S-box protein [Oryzomonas rubra]
MTCHRVSPFGRSPPRGYPEMWTPETKKAESSWHLSPKLMQFVGTFLFALLLQSSPAISALSDQPPRHHHVLILYGRVTNLPTHGIINKGLLPALSASDVGDSDLFQEYLDLQHHPDHKYRLELADYLRKKYADETFDVVIALYQDALDFMLREGKELFVGTPIVAAVPKGATGTGNGGRRVLQVVYSFDSLATLHYALALLPETKEIIVISGPTADDAPHLKNAQDAVKDLDGKFSIRYLINNSLPEILEEVARERDHAIILYTRLSKDARGTLCAPAIALSDIARAAKSPVFGLYDSLLGAGIVGGNLLSFKDLGQAVARLSIDLIHNRLDARMSHVDFVNHVPMFDWAEMRRWGLQKSRLPKGSILINYRPGFWEQYWGYALIALLFLAGEASLIAYLIRSRRSRIQKEKELQKSEEKYRRIITTAREGIIVTGQDYSITYVNSHISDLLGYAPEELIGTPLPHLVPGDDSSSILTRMNSRRRGESGQYECRYRRKDGSSIWLLVSATPILDDEGRFQGSFAMFTDLTDLKQAEEDRLNLERQLLHAQKLESLEVLAGGIAHDFNNILTSIIGYTELAMLRLNPDSPVRDNLKRIEQSAQRAAELARQMLAYSGKGNFVVEPVDLNRLVEDIGPLIEAAIPKNVQLRFEPTNPLPRVTADAGQIRQVVMNLVINASEAIGDHDGSITIGTGWKNCDQGYLRGAWLSDNIAAGLYVYLEVTDTGCGMDRETKAKIFDPFFTTKFTGRGLGMATVQGIVHGHKGSIQIYTEPGKGSIFRILLPAAGEQAGYASAERQETDFQGDGTVLLVDDEEDVRDIGREMLQLLGYTVVTADDGAEALAAFKENPAVTGIILDLTMPHLDGEHCFRELRKLDPKVKVIMSSGYSVHDIARKFAGLGLAGFIQKPYTLSSLRQVLMDSRDFRPAPDETGGASGAERKE